MFEADKDITDLRDSKKLSNLSPDTLAKFRQWMVGFCVVNFDLEIGQGMHICTEITPLSGNEHKLKTNIPVYATALDFVYPPVELTEYEEKNM